MTASEGRRAAYYSSRRKPPGAACFMFGKLIRVVAVDLCCLPVGVIVEVLPELAVMAAGSGCQVRPAQVDLGQAVTASGLLAAGGGGIVGHQGGGEQVLAPATRVHAQAEASISLRWPLRGQHQVIVPDQVPRTDIDQVRAAHGDREEIWDVLPPPGRGLRLRSLALFGCVQ